MTDGAGAGRAYRGLDVDDHERFARPTGRSRPRTKRRPAYADAVPAFVVAVDRGRYTCLPVGTADPAAGGTAGLGTATDPVVAVRSRSLGRRAIVVGDRVGLVGDLATARRPADADVLARVVTVVPRTTVLRRSADDADPVERVIVANADLLVIVAALAEPEPRPRLIDRCLVAAYDAGIEPLLCLTKADLAPPDELLATYRPLGVDAVVTRRGADLAALRSRLAGRESVLVGPSGVGKSTLVNALAPVAARATGAVNPVTGRGRHTSSGAVAVPLPGGGFVVDTPGVRSFGLAHVSADRLLAAFPGVAAVAAGCPRGCPHLAGAPECALDVAVAAGELAAERVASYRRLLASRPHQAGD